MFKIVVKSNRLNAVADSVPRAALEIVQQVATGIHSATVARTPIGPTGDLARGWDMTPGGGELTPTGAYAEIFNNVEYAPYVEFGTGQRGAASSFPGKPEGINYTAGWAGMAARPMLTPSVEEGRGEWKREWRSLRRRLRA